VTRLDGGCRQLAYSIVAALAIGCGPGTRASGGQQLAEQGPVAIAAIEGLLFYSDRGTFSENVIDNTSFRLWNIPVGAGSAQGRSTELLVRVTVKGPSETHGGRYRLHVRVVSGRFTLTDSTTIGILNREGEYFAGFWLRDVGCQTVSIDARLLERSREVSRVNKSIPFQCGE